MYGESFQVTKKLSNAGLRVNIDVTGPSQTLGFSVSPKLSFRYERCCEILLS